MEKNKCQWYQEEFDGLDYSTSCGENFSLNDNTLEENGMKFCCFCGKEIEGKLYI